MQNHLKLQVGVFFFCAAAERQFAAAGDADALLVVAFTWFVILACPAHEGHSPQLAATRVGTLLYCFGTADYHLQGADLADRRKTRRICCRALTYVTTLPGTIVFDVGRGHQNLVSSRGRQYSACAVCDNRVVLRSPTACAGPRRMRTLSKNRQVRDKVEPTLSAKSSRPHLLGRMTPRARAENDEYSWMHTQPGLSFVGVLRTELENTAHTGGTEP